MAKKIQIFKKKPAGSAPAKKPILKKAGKVAAAVATGGVSLLASKKGQAAVKKVGQKAATAAKAVATKTAAVAKKVAGKGEEVAMLALFGPLAPIARAFLKRRGITPAKDLKALALQVHNEKTKKSFGYGGGDAFDYGVSGTEEFGYLDHLGVEHAEFGMVPVTPAMISAVISFLKGIVDIIKKKKANNEPLSPEEAAVAEEINEIDQQLDQAKGKAADIVNESQKDAEKVVDQGQEKVDEILTGESKFLNWKTGLALLIVIVLFLWFRSR